MITILHGDNIVDSRNELISSIRQAKDKGVEVVGLDGKTVELPDLVQALESQSFFSNDRLVAIEELMSSLRPGKKRDDIIDYLVKGEFDAELVLWERKGVGRSIIKLKRAKHVKAREFKTPAIIFSFVESLYPGNVKHALLMFKNIIKQSEPEFVFAMIVRQFRIMIALRENASISEVKRLAPWQRGKFKRQLSMFKNDSLRRCYKQLLTIDYQIKTGRSALNLTKHIQQLIMNL